MNDLPFKLPMTFFWPGMIQCATLAVIMVASVAPTMRKAARPANSWQASQLSTTTKAATTASTRPSLPILPSRVRPSTWLVMSYTADPTTRKPSAAATACQGFCRAELDVFRSVLGPDATVTRDEHIVSGGRRCSYAIQQVQP